MGISSLLGGDDVTAAIEGLALKGSVRAATTSTLPAYTYDNGSDGVGAKLTGVSNGALAAQDSISLSVNELLLVKDEAGANAPYNGIYKLTQVGDGSNPYILTRTDNFNSSATIVKNAFLFIEGGVTLADTGWLLNLDTDITVGTTDIIFLKFTGGISIIDGEVNTYADLPAAASHGGETYYVQNWNIANPTKLSGFYLSDGVNWNRRSDKVLYSLSTFSGAGRIVKTSNSGTQVEEGILESDIFNKSTNDTDDITEGLANLFFTAARAIGSVLTGYTKGAGTVSATDNILQAIQKLDGNDDLKAETLQDAYNNSSDGQIINDATRGSFKIKRGSAANTDNVFEILDGSGIVVASFTANKRLNIGSGNAFNLDKSSATSPTINFDSNDYIIYSTGANEYRFFINSANVFAIDGSGNVTLLGTLDGRDVAADGSKLDGIESGADVTNSANVTSSLGSASLTAVTVATDDKVIVQDTSDSDNIKTVTAQSIADLASSSSKDICQLFWSNGDPTVSGNAIPTTAAISGNTVIQANTGFYQARLTTATNGISGKLEWNFSLNLEDSYFATFEHFAAGGTGADGMIYYFGCDVSPNSAVGPTNLAKGIAITIDEYNDRLRVYVNGSQVAEVTSLTSFDNSTWQKWYVQVRGDFIEVYNINYGATWIFPVKTSGIDMSGTYHGVQAQTGGANNEHYARFIALYNGIKGGLVAS